MYVTWQHSFSSLILVFKEKPLIIITELSEPASKYSDAHISHKAFIQNQSIAWNMYSKPTFYVTTLFCEFPVIHNYYVFENLIFAMFIILNK